MPDAPLIYGLLIEAKKRIGAVRKEGHYDGKGSGSYDFRGVDQVTNAVAGHFIDLGILCTPKVLKSTHDVYEAVRKDGSVQRAFHHIMRVRYTFVAAGDGSKHSATVEGESIDYSDKGTAQTQSVAMRVALLQALTLPTDEPDPDSTRNEIVSAPVQAEEHPELEMGREAAQAAIATLDDADKELVKLEIRNQKIPSLKRPGATGAQLDTLLDFIQGLKERREPWLVEGEGGSTGGSRPDALTSPPSHPEPEAIPFEPVLAKKQADAVRRGGE